MKLTNGSILRSRNMLLWILNDSYLCTDDSLRGIQPTSAHRDKYIYFIIKSVASYMFRPPIKAIFREVLLKEVLHRRVFLNRRAAARYRGHLQGGVIEGSVT